MKANFNLDNIKRTMTGAEPEEKLTKEQVNNRIMAKSLHELNPARTEAEWLEHVEKNGHDPVKFFNGNVEGLQEYNTFVSSYDKDKYEQQQRIRRQREERRKKGN